MTDLKPTLDWLLEGDAAVRWQTLRDLCSASAAEVAAERARVATTGWGARLLACQDPSGRWGGSLYSGKWLSTTYSLLHLRQMGLEPGHPQALRGCRDLLEGGWRPGGGLNYARTVATIDDAVVGLVLSVLAYFAYPDERLDTVADYLIGQQQPDGRWEPYQGNNELRYTLASTLVALEGLLEYEQGCPAGSERAGRAAAAGRKGREFLLGYRLYLSPATGQPIHPQMLIFAFPPRWFYDALTALDYFRAAGAQPDPRLRAAVDLLRERQGQDGAWKLGRPHPGRTFFEMEAAGRPSRWNTLRALRVLKWWEAG